MGKMMMIGDLAAATGVKVNTIRFYEEIGLMPRPPRTPSGRRTYEQADIRRLKFVRHVRKLGFDTDEIRSLLRLTERPEQDCDKVTEIARRHLKEVNAKIAQLKLMRKELDRMAEICSGGTAATCQILELLSAKAR